MSGDNKRELLKEIGGVPQLPTKAEIDNLVAAIQPVTLQRAQTQLRDAWRRKKDMEMPTKLIKSEELSVNDEVHRTRILEMELLKLKGEFKKNKTCTKNLIKKLSNEREMVNDSIKELSLTRKEELSLVEAIKRDNAELLEQKHELQMDLICQTDRIEMIMGTLKEAEQCLKEKDQRLQELELERFEMSKKIETLELKLKVTEYESKQSQRIDWAKLFATHQPLLQKSVFLIVLFFVVSCFLYAKSIPGPLPEPFCKDCDYERDIYTRIHT